MDEMNNVNSGKKRKPKKKKSIIIICIIALVLVAFLVNAISEISDNGGFSDSPQLTVLPGDEDDNGTIIPKTIMVYLDGADLEENNQNSSRTIKEIIDSGVDTERHNILLYTGGCNLWHDYEIPVDKDCIYIIKNGAPQLLKEYDARNMGEARTLETFMEYCVTNYPAQQYGLILHNHGGGPNNGVCADFRHNKDMLNISELQSAFSGAGFGPDSKMEFVFFDACLMGSVEVAFGIKDYAHYMVASENVSYIYGSDYSFINAIDKYNSGALIGQSYVDCFYNESMDLGYRIQASGSSVYDITYSCIRLSEIDKLELAISELFDEAEKSQTLKNALSDKARWARGVMEYADSYGVSQDITYDLIDLVDWLERAAYVNNTLIDNVCAAVNSAVVCNRSNTSHMNGLTIYHPRNAQYRYSYDNLGFSEEYSEYVQACYAAADVAAGAATWNTISAAESSDNSGSKLSVTLTQEQAQNFASAQYYILAKHSNLDHKFAEDEYILVAQGSDCILSDNVLTATFDYRVPVIYESDGTVTPFFSPLFRKITDNGETVYSASAGLHYLPAPEDYTGPRDEDGMNELEWMMDNFRLDMTWLTLQKNGDSLEYLYAEKVGNGGLPSRVLVSPYDYNEIEFTNAIRRVKYDKNGKVAPVSEWETDTTLTLSVVAPVNDITIKLQQLPDEVKYYGVMVVKDIYGNEYSTEILPLN